MLELRIPHRRSLKLKYLLLDINGTISEDGKLISGVQKRIGALRKRLEVILVSCDSRGNATKLAEVLGVELQRVADDRRGEAVAKAAVVALLGRSHVAAIGNGESDFLMLKRAALGVAVVGVEGASVRAILGADICVRSIVDAIDLLLSSERLIATLRA